VTELVAGFLTAREAAGLERGLFRRRLEPVRIRFERVDVRRIVLADAFAGVRRRR
jgi:hypothetical protein